MSQKSRRQFIGDVGYGMLAASVGSTLIEEMGFASPPEISETRLHFGEHEPLVALLQETEPTKLLRVLVERLHGGLPLKSLVSAAALANARTFGGEDYIGFHTMMALAPAYRMSSELPKNLQPLPVLKVLYRNTNRIKEFGGPEKEVLKKIQLEQPLESLDQASVSSDSLREAVRSRDAAKAEWIFASLVQGSDSAAIALNSALLCVEDETEIHRVALPYRAWDVLEIVGMEHAHTMLRQSIRYCVKAGKMSHGPDNESPSTLLPRLVDQFHLDRESKSTKKVDSQWVRHFSETIFRSSAGNAAEATAGAIAEGIDGDAIGRAITLAANQLVLRDRGRTPREEQIGKPIGSVHGDSIGVHATDSANAWRNLAKHADAKNRVACLILGAYQVAYDRVARGGDFLHWDALPVSYTMERIQESDPTALLSQLDDAIKNNLQSQSAAILARYGQLGHDPKIAFDCMLKYAISEDGALHAEKYYRTVREEFEVAAPEHRWDFAISLARVTASEYGRQAAGYQEAVDLLS